MNIEYELEKDDITLYDLTISIPLPAGSYPTVGSSPTGEWALNTTTHSLDWTVPIVSAQDDSRSANLEFTVGGDDASAFYPVLVSFIGVGSVAGISVGLGIMVLVADTQYLCFAGGKCRSGGESIRRLVLRGSKGGCR